MYRARPKNNVSASKTKWCVGVTNKYEFRMHIGLMRNCNRWVLKNCKSQDKKTSGMHTGNIKLDIGHLHTRLDLLSLNKLELAQNCSQLNISLSATTELLNICN